MDTTETGGNQQFVMANAGDYRKLTAIAIIPRSLSCDCDDNLIPLYLSSPTLRVNTALRPQDVGALTQIDGKFDDDSEMS